MEKTTGTTWSSVSYKWLAVQCNFHRTVFLTTAQQLITWVIQVLRQNSQSIMFQVLSWVIHREMASGRFCSQLLPCMNKQLVYIQTEKRWNIMLLLLLCFCFNSKDVLFLYCTLRKIDIISIWQRSRRIFSRKTHCNWNYY